MITLKIIHSKEIDTDRVAYTLGKWDWFQEKKYRLTLPEGISPKSSPEEISSAVDAEYPINEEFYQKETRDLLARWKPYSKPLEEKLASLSLQPLSEYELLLTSYGVGGSYNLPNKIIVNIKACFQFGLLKTVVHEIIHLNIEKYIQEYQISHWVKERIVDLTLRELFPEISRMQELPIPTEEIDKQFHAFYPDLIKVIANVPKNP